MNVQKRPSLVPAFSSSGSRGRRTDKIYKLFTLLSGSRGGRGVEGVGGEWVKEITAGKKWRRVGGTEKVCDRKKKGQEK